MKEKTGIDRNTQIDENDPELFDFDYEVQPILDVTICLSRPYSVKLSKLVEWNSISRNS